MIGHIKGGIRLALTDDKPGVEIMKSASSSTVAVIGALIAGPMGAVGGKASCWR